MPNCPCRGHQSSSLRRLLQCLHRSYGLEVRSLRYWRVAQCLREMSMGCPSGDTHLPVRSALNTTHLPLQLLQNSCSRFQYEVAIFFFLSSLVLCLFPSVFHSCVSSFTCPLTNLIINHEKFLCTRAVLLTSPFIVCRIKTSLREEHGRRVFILERCINSQSRE
jgi:hypothetical protein